MRLVRDLCDGQIVAKVTRSCDILKRLVARHTHDVQFNTLVFAAKTPHDSEATPRLADQMAKPTMPTIGKPAGLFASLGTHTVRVCGASCVLHVSSYLYPAT